MPAKCHATGMLGGDHDQRQLLGNQRHLAAGQQPDGGWRVDFNSFSPAAELEWRGAITVKNLLLLR